MLKTLRKLLTGRLARYRRQRWDLTALLNAADARAARPHRHLWLIRLIEWIRGNHATSNANWSQRRIRHLLYVLEHHPALARQVTGVIAKAVTELDTNSLWADTGFAPRNAFLSELSERIRRYCLPDTPDTLELGKLVRLAFTQEADVQWLAALDDTILKRLAALMHLHHGAGPHWSVAVAHAVAQLGHEIRATSSQTTLRLRMDANTLRERPFERLTELVQTLQQLLNRQDDSAPPNTQAIHELCHALREVLAQCRQAVASIHAHLDEHGISVDVIFMAYQLRERTQRIEHLLHTLDGQHQTSCALSPIIQLLTRIIQQDQQRRGIRALFAHHYSMLSRKVAERSGDIGAHYITSSRNEYWEMLRRALIGGGVLALTTLCKLLLATLGMSLFWSGWWAGCNYAVSFVVIHLLHGVVATKQPAMTAAAIATRLRHLDNQTAIEQFVNHVAQLVRSQLAGIAGNLLAVTPAVLLIQVLCWQLTGSAVISHDKAVHILHDNSLLGPSLLFAALTGVILFTGSLIAGWVENWFFWHRLDSAIAWNPRFIAALGTARAQRWAHWWRQNISGMASNISLGLMLGLLPVYMQFFGIPLEVRHVTLVTGQIMAAAGTLGTPVIHDATFWWAVAAIPLIGLINLSISFLLALRARGIQVTDRRTLMRAVWQGLKREPRRFVLPPNRR